MTARNTHTRAQRHETPLPNQDKEQAAVGRGSQVMTIAQIRKTFIEEWVVTKVTAWDKADAPLGGGVLKHGPNKRAVYHAAKGYLAQHPTARLFIFFTGDPIPRNVEAILALG